MSIKRQIFQCPYFYTIMNIFYSSLFKSSLYSLETQQIREHPLLNNSHGRRYLAVFHVVVAQRIDLFIPYGFRHCVIAPASQEQKIHCKRIKFTISFWQSLQPNLVSIAMDLFSTHADPYSSNGLFSRQWSMILVRTIK